MEKYKKILDEIRRIHNKKEGFIPLHAPVFMGNEKKYLEECITSTFVSSVGKFVDDFEKAIAKYTNVPYAVACVNGTAALHLALKLVGVRNNEEVITQALSFVATANAISYCGAQPVFLDIDKDNPSLSAEALKNWLNQNVKVVKNIAINQKTGKKIAACVPMHTYGHPCKIDEIVEICNEYNIPVVEDAAESLGSFYKEKHTGTFGKIGILSFNGNKIITSGGGGMLLFNDIKLAKKAKHLSTQAKVPHKWEFAHDCIGYNYRMPNINAGLGLAQLECIDDYLESKRKTAKAYESFFLSQNIHFIGEPKNAKSNYWLNCILFENKRNRNDFLELSNTNQVMTRPAWELIHKLPMYRNCETDALKNSSWIEERLVNIPSSVL
jgi:aminotransferase in exopolysaccharide biosynthesis